MRVAAEPPFSQGWCLVLLLFLARAPAVRDGGRARAIGFLFLLGRVRSAAAWIEHGLLEGIGTVIRYGMGMGDGRTVRAAKHEMPSKKQRGAGIVGKGTRENNRADRGGHVKTTRHEHGRNIHEATAARWTNTKLNFKFTMMKYRSIALETTTPPLQRQPIPVHYHDPSNAFLFPLLSNNSARSTKPAGKKQNKTKTTHR